MFPKRLLLFVSLLGFSLSVTARESYYYYLVYLKDKLYQSNASFSVQHPEQFLSPKALARRQKYGVAISESDLPVSEQYVMQISAIKSCEVWNRSKWLNAVEIRTQDSSIVKTIQSLYFVERIQFLGYVTEDEIPKSKIDSSFFDQLTLQESPLFNETTYGRSYQQNSLINIPPLHRLNYLGNGITIAVFDAGFNNVYQTPGMLFKTGGVICKDFVTHDNSVWEDDRHGANVLSFMRTYDPGTYIGTAPMSNYILIRTEQASSEFPTEEMNWLSAAEFADSIGVDMISSSLGYTEFDDKQLSHTHADLNGKKSIIANAANMANSKGIVVIVSAGNEGKSSWRKIGTPADAQGVISIGATDSEGFYADFSSFGLSADGRIKPDLVVMGKKAYVASPGGTYQGNGTSYSTPLFAGAMACLMEACPNKSIDELKAALIASSSHFYNPDSAYGYGIPDLALAAFICGNTQIADTAQDQFWQNEYPVYFQNQLIHFRSSKDQTIQLVIKVKTKKRWKTISSKSIVIKKGEWIHNNDLKIFIDQRSKLKKRKRYKELQFDLISPSATYMRSFTFQ
ncbi:MAG: S8 family serine peptidase [Bacteroidota bacterium]